MAFKKAKILQLRKVTDEQGTLVSLVLDLDVRTSKEEFITEQIVINATELVFPNNATPAQKRKVVSDAIKNKIKEQYLGWANKRGYKETGDVVIGDESGIATELGFSEIDTLG